jgi:hypothetical protein
MKLMFIPVTMIEELPHLLLYYNFSKKKDRYFLSPHEVDISKHGSQKTVTEIIQASDFLCGLLGIDRPMILKQTKPITTSETTEPTSTTEDNEQNTRRALSAVTITESNDSLITMIEQKLDFKHRCMFYSAGATSDLCGKLNICGNRSTSFSLKFSLCT